MDEEKELLKRAAKIRMEKLKATPVPHPQAKQVISTTHVGGATTKQALGRAGRQSSTSPLKDLERKIEQSELKWTELRDALIEGIPAEKLETIRAVIRAEERESLREQFEKMLEEAYEQAYEMVRSSHEKYTQRLAEIDDLWADAENKVKDIRTFMVDKIDEFIDQNRQQALEMTGEEVFKAVMGKKYPSIDDNWATSKEEFDAKKEAIKQKMKDDLE